MLLWGHSVFYAVGVEEPRACYAFHFGVSFVIGHAANELGAMAMLREGRRADPSQFDDPVARNFLLSTADLTPDEMFDNGLDLVVAGAVAAGVPVQGALQTRDDARRLILDVCKFLERTEPSHPAPYFLRRAERLLSAKDFFAIMRDMAPDALNELERITGHREETE